MDRKELYRKEIVIGNPKQFQRLLYILSSNILFPKGYFSAGFANEIPFLKSNGIINTADFYGKLYFFKNTSDFKKKARIAGIVLMAAGAGLLLSQIETVVTGAPTIGFIGIALIIIGLILYFVKWGKEIAIKIELIGESYRVNKEDPNAKIIENLEVKSHAQLSMRAIAAHVGDSLNDEQFRKLSDDMKPIEERFEVIVSELNKND